MTKKCRVGLREVEQEELKALVSKGLAAAYKQTRTCILMLSNENQADDAMQGKEIARALKVGIATVERMRGRGADVDLRRKQQLNRRRKSWMVRVRPTWLLWPPSNRRKDGSVGLCKCWLTDWCSEG